MHFVLERTVDLLLKHGFIAGSGREFPIFQIAENWRSIQEALGISLTDLSDFGPKSLVTTPYFGRPGRELETLDLFVVMSFNSELQPVYADHIMKVAGTLGLTVKRADDFFNARAVMTDIWEAICAARVIIADCTGRSPNVFYEIGLAHVLGKPVLLITQNIEDIPFDLGALRYIHYQYTPRGMATFESTLAKTLQAALNLSEAG
jgi:hypothetical protein